MKNNLNEKHYLDKLFTYEEDSRHYERLDDFPYTKLQGEEGIYFMYRERGDNTLGGNIFVITHKILTQEVNPDDVLVGDYSVTLISTPDEPDATLYNIEVTKLYELLKEL